MVASRKIEIPFYRGKCRQHGRGLDAFAKSFGELQFHSCLNLLTQLQNIWVPICATLMRQNLHKSLVVEKFSRQLQRMYQEEL